MIEPAYDADGITLVCGDAREVMAAMEPESVDAIVTDPPYGLEFMGKEWDKLLAKDRHVAYPSCRGTHGPNAYRAGLEAQEWHYSWAVEALRVLKPGGHMVAFGGTRTFHRLACALEDAGFEIRDCLMWLYGQGFPKSADVSKAIDKAAGAERVVVRPNPHARPNSDGEVHGYSGKQGHDPFITAPATDAARQWQGWGTALKPAWEPILLCRKPLSGTVAANVQRWGTGALNIDGCRIGTNKEVPASPSRHKGTRTQGEYGLEDGSGSGFNPNIGRWPANLVLECTCEETREGWVETGKAIGGYKTSSSIYGTFMGRKRGAPDISYADPDGTEPVCVHTDPNCPAALLDAQSGERKSPAPYIRKSGSASKQVYGEYESRDGGINASFGDSGGASRFFYCAKASNAERGDGNRHPTVKPLALMSWLCKLITPPGGLILDPFVGSGTTALAARMGGFRCIGIDTSEEYVGHAIQRLSLGPEAMRRMAEAKRAGAEQAALL